METPYINHLTSQDYEFVYEPAEDSFFLLDALEADLPFIEKLQPALCVEIGSGSGVIITALAKKLNSAHCMAIDINYKACLATKQTAMKNSAAVDILNMDLTCCLRPSSVDLLVFNPPYVVTEGRDYISTNNIKNQNLIYSWDGGANGRQTIDKLLSNLHKILSPNGVLYLLVLKENDPNSIVQSLSDLGLESGIFMERKIPGKINALVHHIKEKVG